MINLRKLIKSDLPAVLTIEQAVHITPWTAETFDICFQSHCLGFVAEVDGRIVGFIMVSAHVGECHVLNIAVLHKFQRQGLGARLLIEALAAAKLTGSTIAYLEVRKSNTRAIALYLKMQFKQVGERKDYYPSHEGYEDAIIFAKSLV
jgi:ribosomal-protein-alanine N-acetyltransferase